VVEEELEARSMSLLAPSRRRCGEDFPLSQLSNSGHNAVIGKVPLLPQLSTANRHTT
jgi:hypothetical protein